MTTALQFVLVGLATIAASWVIVRGAEELCRLASRLYRRITRCD